MPAYDYKHEDKCVSDDGFIVEDNGLLESANSNELEVQDVVGLLADDDDCSESIGAIEEEPCAMDDDQITVGNEFIQLPEDTALECIEDVEEEP